MGLFSYILLQCIVYYDLNLTISQLDRPITAVFTKGFFHDDVIYPHPLFVNNSNNYHYFTNYSKTNISVSTNEQLNSKPNN